MVENDEMADMDVGADDIVETFLRPLSDPKGIKECLDKYGAVGITGVLTEEEVNETVIDIEEMMKFLVKDNAFAFSDKSTFHLADRYLNNFGVIGKESLFTKTLTRNRFHPNVQLAYEIAYGKSPQYLVAQYDRVAWMRPTIGPLDENLSKYRTMPNTHLDINPESYFNPSLSKSVYDFLNNIPYTSKGDFMKENNVKCQSMGLQLQGVLNLFDNEEEDGGFAFVPEGHKKLYDWYIKRRNHLPAPVPSGRYGFTKADHEFSYAVRLPCPKGTLIIFDASLPHGTKSNKSKNQRMIQFIRYMPKSTLSKDALKRRTKFIRSELNAIGYKLTPSELNVL